MSLNFFDANAFIGQPVCGCHKPAVTPAELKTDLAAAGISRALIWHIGQHDNSPVDGNRLLNEAIQGDADLWGCWTILPPQTGEVIGKGFFEQMKRHRIVSLRAFPARHHYLLNRTVFGRFLDELTERKVPLMLSVDGQSLTSAGWPQVYSLLEEFPDLTCILCDIGIWPSNRYTWPLLEKFSNVYIETSLLSLTARGVEATVEKFGASRLLFGSGFPLRYPEASVLQLTHADISDEDKAMIAGGNLERLVSEVIL